MQTFIASAFIFLVVAAAMAVGVIFSNRSLQGSCGGSGTNCSCSETRQRECAMKREAEEAQEAG
ncbi:MAG: hypothetical protein QF570_15155 [Myxococcota bacterium]|nr:hypothetical protein [Myxococcota bacterium]